MKGRTKYLCISSWSDPHLKSALLKSWNISEGKDFCFYGSHIVSPRSLIHCTTALPGNSQLWINLLIGIILCIANKATSIFCWLGCMIVMVCNLTDLCTYLHLDSKSEHINARSWKPTTLQVKGTWNYGYIKKASEYVIKSI